MLNRWYKRKEEQDEEGGSGIAMRDVLESYDIFSSRGEVGGKKTLDRPADFELSQHFGTTDKEKVIEMILTKGEMR